MLNSFNSKVIAVAAVCGALGVAGSSAKATVFQSNDLPSGSILLAKNEENSLTPDPLLDNDANLDKANDTAQDQKVEGDKPKVTAQDQKVEADKENDAKSQALSDSEKWEAERAAEREKDIKEHATEIAANKMKEEAYASLPEDNRKKIEGLRSEVDKLIGERDKYLNGAEIDERDIQAGKPADSVGPETLRAEAKNYEDQARQKLNEAEKEWSATDKKLFFEKNPNSTPEQYEKHVKEVKPDFEIPQR